MTNAKENAKMYNHIGMHTYPGRTIMVQFECGRCGKTQLEPFGSCVAPEGWRENERKTPLLCPECHKAYNDFMNGGWL